MGERNNYINTRNNYIQLINQFIYDNIITESRKEIYK